MFVHSVQPCRAFPFYGYSAGFECFLKVELLNPTYVYKCSELLVQGELFQEPMQPHEGHIPYLLAFLVDYNLYGCQWMDFGRDFQERGPTSAERTAYEGMEVDIDASSIVNRKSAAQDTRHAEIFEPPDDSTAISSLDELSSVDQKRRSELGIEPWETMTLYPSEENVEKAMSWQWECSNDHRAKLNGLLSASEAPLQLDLWAGLPTAAELVKSNFALPPMTGEATQGRSESLQNVLQSTEPRAASQLDTLTQPNTQQHRAALTLSALPSSSIFDDVQMAFQDQAAVTSAAREASFILASQFVPQTSTSAYQTSSAFGVSVARILRAVAPSTEEIEGTAGISSNMYAHYSNPADTSSVPFPFAGEDHVLKSMQPVDLPRFELAAVDTLKRLAVSLTDEDPSEALSESSGGLLKRFELAVSAPSYATVAAWHDNEIKLSSSLNSGSAFQFASLEEPEPVTEEMLLMAVEVYSETRPGKTPNAAFDPICAVFWRLSGVPKSSSSSSRVASRAGVITTSPILDLSSKSYGSLSITAVDSEAAVLDSLIDFVRRFNPDILTGYEVAHSSWGLIRARYKNLQPDGADRFYEQLSRVKLPRAPGWKVMTSGTGAPVEEAETVHGRHLLSLWNILRHEVTLSKYTLEHVVYHTLHERTPHFDYDDLWSWWSSGDTVALAAVVRYWSERVMYVIKLFAHFEIVSKTCEKSRIIGLDFMSSLSRGSQFQVEAVMCRISRRENFLLVSPTKKQVGQQNALEHIPLVMEPMSGFYTDPVCVLDFRSLYPSIVIAFNLCYSTCIGRLDMWRGRNKLGIKQDHVLPPGILNAIGAENVYFAPNGIGYVSPKVRRSLLARMLGEILESRFMINDSKKFNKANKRFQRNLNSQQLALKFIANVTYGYTSASFTGRMPCAELADSIVLSARELLQWSIQQIEGCEKWGIQPQVVYGDTDSLFVRLPKVSREQGFRIGREIAEMITEATPDPIFLKLEKVYSPCILLTKKRYVGNAYESPNSEPKFDAKGTETVRRDGTPIVQKIEKRALQLLFSDGDLSRVKSYLQNQWRRILSGRVTVQDFCFAQEVKLGHYKTSKGTSSLPGGAMVTLKKLAKDEGLEPLYRERVPFVITAGAPGSRINDRAVSPEDVVSNPSLKVDAEYYIQKTIIPPLERLLNMIGANVRDWYKNMPRTLRMSPSGDKRVGVGPSNTLLGFFSSDSCASCLEGRRLSTDDVLCSACRAAGPRSRYLLTSRMGIQERRLAAAAITCRLCSELPPSATPSGFLRPHPCGSLDCPVFYEREEARVEARILKELVSTL